MKCLKITKTLSIISTILASELGNSLSSSNLNSPISNPVVNSLTTSNTPNLDTTCKLLSYGFSHLTDERKVEYECLCKKLDDQSKAIMERVYDFNTQEAKKQNLSSRDVSRLFKDILKYLRKEIFDQNELIEYISNESDKFPTLANSELTTFIIKNAELSLKELYSKYTEFLVNKILKDFSKNIEKLKVFNIPDLFKIHVTLMNCTANHNFETGKFKKISDVLGFVHGRLLFLTVTMAFEFNEFSALK